jgi:lipopolysaccharide/colanic/teichoic acid biosynthesis glycosyltransferase
MTALVEIHSPAGGCVKGAEIDPLHAGQQVRPQAALMPMWPAGVSQDARLPFRMEVIPLTIQTGTGQTRPDVLPLAPTSRPKIRKAPPVRQALSFPAAAVTPRRRWYVPCKSGWELAAALVLLVLAAPVIFVAGLLVKLTSRGPVFYTQTRVGRHGSIFTIYKIRTMVHDCESLTGPRWAIPGDPRVTRVGQFLRRTHLDELPQLLNVLRGEMSLIGPRPERPEFLPALERALPSYRCRLNVHPGVTGLAQVILQPDTDLSSVKRKLTYDLHYVEHLSFWLDMRILLCTALKTIGDPARLAQRLCRAAAGEEIEMRIEESVPQNSTMRARRVA